MRGRIVARGLFLMAALPVLVLMVTVSYMAGMNLLEGEPRDFWQSLAWAAETLTTTGYGHDNQWHNPLMIVFVVAVQFVGLFMVFLLFPIFIVPFFESRFEERLPRTLPARLRDFVLIYHYGPAVTSLIEDMQRQQIPAVILEDDEALARRLRNRGLSVVYRRLDEQDPLGGGLLRARAIVANGEDRDNAVVVLSARELGYEGPIHAFVENPFHRQPIVVAGATAAYSPKHALAAALAAKASDRISPRVAGLQQLGEGFEVAELRIDRGSPLAHRTLARARIREQTGATVIGLWVGGAFSTEVGPETLLMPRSIVVAIGSSESIERLGRLATPLAHGGPFVVLGCGEVGGRVVEMLSDAGEETFVIDQRPRDGVDLVADARDPEALHRAGVSTARAVILALESDSANLFEATIVRDLAPDVPIIARVNLAEEVGRIHAAGADFVLSIGQVAGQLLERQLFGAEFISVEPRMRLAKCTAAGLEGLSPESSRVRQETGCSIVAIEREGKILFELGRSFEIHAGDAIVLCGSDEAVSRYFDRFPAAKKSAQGL
jgi:Trk K+ transport system NAD-binding subunit